MVTPSGVTDTICLSGISRPFSPLLLWAYFGSKHQESPAMTFCLSVKVALRYDDIRYATAAFRKKVSLIVNPAQVFRPLVPPMAR